MPKVGSIGVWIILLTSPVMATDHKTQILEWIRLDWKDPYSIRSARISLPVDLSYGSYHASVVCVELNAKNSFGGYTGITARMFHFKENTLSHTEAVTPPYDYTCNHEGRLYNFIMEPFPEAENIR